VKDERVQEAIPTWKIVVFSLGGIGNAIIGSLMGLLTYFYVPPETAQAAFPAFITTKTFLGLTFVGLSGFIGNLLFLLLGPLVANWSDRSRSRMGRRKAFMLVAFLPLAAFTYLLFAPPVAGVSAANAAWLIAVIVFLNISRALYNVSGALVPEFGVNSGIIMKFGTYGAITWLVGYVMGSQLIFLVKDLLMRGGMSPVDAFRLTVGALIALSTVLLALQVFVVDEKRYGSGKASAIALLPALKKALGNRNFVLFTLIQQVYFWGDGFFQGGLVYFVTVLFGLPESMMLAFGGTIVLLSLVLYPIVGSVASKVGKKKLFLAALAVMTVVMVLFAFAGIIPLPRIVLAWIIVALTAAPSAVTGIIPGAMTNEIVREDCLRTGQPNEASFGAAAGILTAIPSGFVGLVMPSILLLGKGAANPAGIRLVALAGAACMALAFVALAAFYREKKLLASLASYGYE